MIIPEGDSWVQDRVYAELGDDDRVAMALEDDYIGPGERTRSHERIKAVQRVRSKRASRRRASKPSTCMEASWLYADRKTKRAYPAPTDNSGKWLVFAPPAKIDALWSKVADATVSGQLGGSSKVSTKLVFRDGNHVICVYTYDWTDWDDVSRVRVALRKLGVTEQIPYKSDEDTLKGRYATKGDKRISKYYL